MLNTRKTKQACTWVASIRCSDNNNCARQSYDTASIVCKATAIKTTLRCKVATHLYQTHAEMHPSEALTPLQAPHARTAARVAETRAQAATQEAQAYTAYTPQMFTRFMAQRA